MVQENEVMMKVAIYTIALNERQFVEKWYEAAKEADYLLIADTGSTDGTIEAAKELGINIVEIKVSPWRFDDARNAALAALPLDIDMCISLDMDEVITPNWREPLQKAWEAGVTRPRYKHIWSWNEDGTPGLEFSYDHIHARKGYRWKHPVHECLYVYGMEEKQQWISEIETHHHPDPTKSRSQYLPLLKMSVQEDPYNDRNAFYYGRELYFYGKYQEAAVELKRHLELPTAHWAPERAASMRFIGKSLPAEAEIWFRKAIEQAPGRREPYMDLTKLYYDRQDWPKCLEAAETALAIQEKPLEYLCEAESWGAAPYDYASIAAYRLGMFEKALEYAKKAVEIEPGDERMIKNVMFCEAALSQDS
jgi:glycosyltransferase involved in cell wall biosynthesis